MAKAIREIVKADPTPEALQAMALTDLIKSVSDNKDAILDTLEILGHLKDMGILSALKGLLAERQKVAEIAMTQMNQPSMHHMLKNIMIAIQTLGSIQPGHLERILKGVSHGLESSKGLNHDDGSSPGVWELMKTMREPQVRASIATMVGFMKGMGESLQMEEPSQLH